MEITTDEFFKLQQVMSAKDIEIARLKEQVAQLTDERDQWMARALDRDAEQADAVVDKQHSGKFIVLSVELLKTVLSKIHNLNILSVVALVLQKALHRDDNGKASSTIAELVPLPPLPTISLTANGDIDVEGNWNDIHNNDNVNL